VKKKMMMNSNDMSNKDTLILVLIIVSNSASSQHDDIDMATSKVKAKATTKVATDGSSTNQARHESQSNPTSPTSAQISARKYDRRH
jgi:hypothetical protein